MMRSILIVEDDSTQRNILKYVVSEKLGYKVSAVAGADEAIQYIADRRVPIPDMILLDYELGGKNALDVLGYINKIGAEIPVIVITAFGDAERSMSCMHAGAYDFLSKPVHVDRLNVSICNAFERHALRKQLRQKEQLEKSPSQFDQIIGKSTSILHAVEYAKKSAALDNPMLIEGEQGVGKNLFAKTIHASSVRRKHPFIMVDCAGVNSDDMDKILFGIQQGVTISKGSFQEAENGTLYLANINALKLDVQGKILRAIQEREIHVSGSTHPQKIQVRIIASSQESLEQRVESGEFRGDLYYRLSALYLKLPSLKDRREDIQMLTQHFIRTQAGRARRPIVGISPAAMGHLASSQWYGNVRQLENAVYRAVLLTENTILDIADFEQSRGMRTLSQVENDVTMMGHNQPPLMDKLERMQSAILSLVDGSGNMKRMSHLEAETIRFALYYYGGHMSEVARKLGIGRSTLYRKIHDFNIDHPKISDLDTQVA
jgi:DNA-binding NtrC family response regulator